MSGQSGDPARSCRVEVVGCVSYQRSSALSLPAALLLGLACAAAGLAVTTFMRSWQDFDYVTGAIFVLFLFSGTFAPLSAYPGWIQGLISLTPLYHGVMLTRGFT
ncbi:MAG: hypothetical protein GEU94_21860, partial [Micromonosporaceae bacterium]|nr:hypothetical protein [Micromonosporaceae bacterium]